MYIIRQYVILHHTEVKLINSILDFLDQRCYFFSIFLGSISKYLQVATLSDLNLQKTLSKILKKHYNLINLKNLKFKIRTRIAQSVSPLE